MGIVIPKGKKIIINSLGSVKGNTHSTRYYARKIKDFSDIDLVLEEDLTLNFNSSYKPVVNFSANTGFTFISQLTRDYRPFGVEIGSSFKELGFQLYEKTDPITFSTTVSLNMKTDAKKDVFDPMKNLIKLCLPDDLGDSGEGIGLRAPGPSITQALGFNSNKGKDMLYIEIGNILLFPVVVTKAEPIVSKETDQFDYNISAKIRLDVTTIYTATTNLVDEWGVSLAGFAQG